MRDYSVRNKTAWEYSAYDFRVEHNGTPEERARPDAKDPVKMLRRYAAYFDRYEDVKIANICGSCGKKAVPLALLGAQVTMFDISEDNRRYALETPLAGYFSTDVYEGEMAHARFYPDEIRRQMPKCSLRRYTISEIINSVIRCGFTLKRFDEHPAWENDSVPGEFTLIAVK